MTINKAKSKRMEYGWIELIVEEHEAERQLDMELVDSFKYLGEYDPPYFTSAPTAQP